MLRPLRVAGKWAARLHPDYRQIEAEMLTWAEGQLGAPTPDGAAREVALAVFDCDSPRRRRMPSMKR